MKKYVKYTHPSACGYKVDIAYELDEVVEEIGLEKVKILFAPINFDWKNDEKQDF